MNAATGGRFRDLRERHLTLFDESVHRHDRGWPHLPDIETGRDEVQGTRKAVGVRVRRYETDISGRREERGIPLKG